MYIALATSRSPRLQERESLLARSIAHDFDSSFRLSQLLPEVHDSHGRDHVLSSIFSAIVLSAQLGGVTIAELQADLKHQGIRVEDHNVQLYQSSHFLTISGEGFQSGNTRFRFGNGITEGSNFTTNVTEGAAVLSLVENRKWKSVSAERFSARKQLWCIRLYMVELYLAAHAVRSRRLVISIWRVAVGCSTPLVQLESHGERVERIPLLLSLGKHECVESPCCTKVRAMCMVKGL